MLIYVFCQINMLEIFSPFMAFFPIFMMVFFEEQKFEIFMKIFFMACSFFSFTLRNLCIHKATKIFFYMFSTSFIG